MRPITQINKKQIINMPIHGGFNHLKHEFDYFKSLQRLFYLVVDQLTLQFKTTNLILNKEHFISNLLENTKLLQKLEVSKQTPPKFVHILEPLCRFISEMKIKSVRVPTLMLNDQEQIYQTNFKKITLQIQQQSLKMRLSSNRSFLDDLKPKSVVPTPRTKRICNPATFIQKNIGYQLEELYNVNPPQHDRMFNRSFDQHAKSMSHDKMMINHESPSAMNNMNSPANLEAHQLLNGKFF